MKNILISVAIAVVVFLALSFAGAGNLLGGAGAGPTHYQDENFLQGVHIGTSGQLTVSNAGLLTTSGGITDSGTLTQSGTATISGAATFSGGVTLNQTTSSTLSFGGTSSCIAMPMFGTTTLVYLTATSTANTILTSTTKPAGCR